MKCPECPITFKSKDILNWIRCFHKNEKCAECKSTFKTKTKLGDHGKSIEKWKGFKQIKKKWKNPDCKEFF